MGGASPPAFMPFHETYGPRDQSQAGFFAIAAAPDGGYLAVGSSYPFLGTSFAGYAVRVDSAGQVLWERALADQFVTTIGQLESVVPVAGGWLAAGFGCATTRCYGWLVGFGDDGAVRYSQIFPTPGSADHGALAVRSDTSRLVLASSYFVALGDQTAVTWIAERSSTASGVDTHALWSKTYRVNAMTQAVDSIEAQPDGGFLVAGTETPTSGLGTQTWVMRIDDSGAPQWRTRLALAQSDGLANADVLRPTATRLADGRIAVTANQAVTVGSGVFQYACGTIVWLDQFGALLDQQTFCNSTADRGGYVAARPLAEDDGGVTVVGATTICLDPTCPAGTSFSATSGAVISRFDHARQLVWQNFHEIYATPYLNAAWANGPPGAVRVPSGYAIAAQIGDTSSSRAEILVLRDDGTIAPCAGTHAPISFASGGVKLVATPETPVVADGPDVAPQAGPALVPSATLTADRCQ
jgi:hypothetical protein